MRALFCQPCRTVSCAVQDVSPPSTACHVNAALHGHGALKVMCKEKKSIFVNIFSVWRKTLLLVSMHTFTNVYIHTILSPYSQIFFKLFTILITHTDWDTVTKLSAYIYRQICNNKSPINNSLMCLYWPCIVHTIWYPVDPWRTLT